MKSLAAPWVMVLGADQPIDSSVVPVLLTGMSFPVNSGVTYRVRVFAVASPANTAMGYRYQLTGPAMTSWLMSVWVAGISDGPDLELREVDVVVPTNLIQATVTAATPHVVIMEGTFTPSAAGTLELKHAQGTSDAADMTTLRGTSMEVTPL